jgi:hypothetical protein
VDGACGMHGSREKRTGFWWESPKDKDHLKDQGVDRLGSKWTLCRLIGGWGGFTWRRIGIVAGSRECGVEASGSGATDLAS